ncbi:hypothetical protein PIB30_034531 [Stylosanthes scabra]|uniref:Uncharacterized protein n=1 Tax=Stylosanthes scabra TaxID=79078 RepID=A0ABU6RD53_9FABA|nr:hypothetical protein [Stylosanthes scabra]
MVLLPLFVLPSCPSNQMKGKEVKDDRIILDKTLADQVSSWKSSKGLSDTVVIDHACSGETCSYYEIGDVFICKKTGHVTCFMDNATLHFHRQPLAWTLCKEQVQGQLEGFLRSSS